MPIVPVRDVAKYGVITDPDPFDIPTQAWSVGKNVRFANRKISRGPIFRSVHTLGTANPRFLATFNPTNAIDDLFIGYKNGRVFQLASGTETDVSGVLGTVATSAPTSSSTTLTFSATPSYVAAGQFVADLTHTSDIPYGTTVVSKTGTTVVLSAAVTVPSADTIQFSIASSAVEATWTSCHLADVLWLNRSDRAPWYLRASDSAFQQITEASSPTGWDSTWTCQLLRSCGGALVALNFTKGASTFGTMVKTSSFPLSGTIPASWDSTDPSTSATENILAEMEGPIVDACSLGNDLIIYGNQEAWRMTLNPGSVEVFDYVKLPFGVNKGAINANCSVEIGGLHYVFGPEDIWVHDGVSAQSLTVDADGNGIVHDFIYTGLNNSTFNRCFVVHNSRLKEIAFCYVSQDRLNAFPSATDGCNRQAVYNYEKKIWTFDDLPLVYFGVRSNISNALEYANATSSYDTMGGSYNDLQDGYKRAVFYVGDTNATYSLTAQLYGFDVSGAGSILPYAVDTNATKGLYLERDGIDLDEVGADLKGYKLLNSIYPQGRLASNAQPVVFTVGAADYFSESPTLAPTQTWDGETLYKLDYNMAGRYLFMSITFNDYNSMSLSGFDLDLDIQGER